MSNKKRFFIEVEIVSLNLSGNGEWVSVRIPAEGPFILPVRFRDIRNTPPCEECERNGRPPLMDDFRRQRDALRNRVAELERSLSWHERESVAVQRERDEARSEAEAARARSNSDRDATNKACRERDAARREAAELREHIREMTGVQRELARHANAYQRELLEVRRENERLRAAASAVVKSRFDVNREYRNQQMEALRLTIARTTPPAEIADQPAPQPPQPTVDDVWEAADRAGWEWKGRPSASGNYVNAHIKARKVEVDGAPDARQLRDALRMMRALPPAEPDQPAPQTHYRENDLVLTSVGNLRRLGSFNGACEDGTELWESDDSLAGGVCLVPGKHTILERDGTPTDEGLRRLADRAGVSFLRSAAGCNVSWTDERVFLGPDADRDDRRALAAALREMGGA